MGGSRHGTGGGGRQRGRGGRFGPLAHGALALALVVTVIALAYGTAAPTLGVAEFAPAARQAVDPPPTTANDATGHSTTGGRERAATTTTAPPDSTSVATTAPAPTTRVSRARDCVGEPPHQRQTEDPMSPPCIATIFDADNGGATSRGVSGTEIRVAIPMSSGGATSTADWARLPREAIAKLFDYVNLRYELYGRRLVPLFVDGNVANPVEARAHAVDVASRSVFAALTAHLEWNGAHVALPQALGHEGVVTIVRNTDGRWTDRTLFDETHPFSWSVYPSSEDLQANIGDFACRTLAGHTATHAGPALNALNRRFGVVAYGEQPEPPSISVVVNALTDCTGEAPLQTSANSTTLQTGLAKLQADGATTVICVCPGLQSFGTVTGRARQANFYPEWIMHSSTFGGANEDEYNLQNSRASFMPPIRMAAGPKLLPLQARPWFGALMSVGLDVTSSADAYSVWGVSGLIYEQLLILAAGIQGAGPTLTPDTFAAALMGTQFPNPGAGQAPYWQPSVGFGPGDHSLFDDYAVAWWSDTAAALNNPATPGANGSWCYLDQGARYHVGNYPADADQRLFNPGVACR